MNQPISPHGNIPSGTAHASNHRLPNKQAKTCPASSHKKRLRPTPAFYKQLSQASSAIFAFLSVALAGICQAQSSVVIAWDPNPEPDVAGYNVLLGTNPSDMAIHRIITGDTIATLSGLSPSTTYYCAVQAFNRVGLGSGLSEPISFATRPPGGIITLADAYGAALEDGEEKPSGNVRLGALHTQRFIIRNEGTLDLTQIAITSGGPHGQDFSVSGPAVSSLAPGDRTEFTVTFAPSATGLRTGVFHVASNDDLTPSFVFHLSGNAGTDSQLYAQWAAANQLHGDEAKPIATPFGDNVPNVLKYASNLAGNRPDTRTLASPESTAGLPVFSLERGGPSPVFKAEYLQRRNCGLVYTPKISGDLADFTAMDGPVTVTHIDENWSRVVMRKTIDPATTPALFGIVEVHLPETTPAPAPEIAIIHPSGSGMKSGVAGYSFGTIKIGRPSPTETFTITNEGTAPLTGISILADGPHHAEFTISNLSGTTLAVGESMTFDVACLPGTRGTRTNALRILSNDEDERPFHLALTVFGGNAADLFDDWAAASRLTGSRASATATPFGDGVKNLLKYAFNLSGTRPDTRMLTPDMGTAGLPAIRIEHSGQQTQLVMEFLRRKHSDLIYSPEISTGLHHFQPITEVPIVTWIDHQWERVVFRKTIDPGLTPGLFGRVSVTLP